MRKNMRISFNSVATQAAQFYQGSIQPQLNTVRQILKGIDMNPTRVTTPVYRYIKNSSYTHLVTLAVPLVGLTAVLVVTLYRYIRSPHIIATISIPNRSYAPIHGDHAYAFARRITDENQKPLQFSPKDIYIELEAHFQKGNSSFFTDVHGSSRASGKNEILLPSSLFKGCKSGSTLRFHYDGKLVELHCQSTPGKFLFESDLRDAIEETAAYGAPYKFHEDIQELEVFEIRKHKYLLGKEHVRLHPNPCVLQIKDFSFYTTDQKLADYEPLARRTHTIFGKALTCTADQILLDVHQDQIKMEDIHFVQTKGTQNHLFIFIPHQPERRIPKGTVISHTTFDGTPLPYTANTDPTYKFGKYYVIHNIPQNCEPQFYFEKHGFLLIDLSRKSQELT